VFADGPALADKPPVAPKPPVALEPHPPAFLRTWCSVWACPPLRGTLHADIHGSRGGGGAGNDGVEREDIVAGRINTIHNPGFSQGRTGPTRWAWRASEGDPSWFRAADDAPAGERGVTILAEDEPATACWFQSVGVKPGKTYRAEATISFHPFGAVEGGGVYLSVRPLGDDESAAVGETTPPIARSSIPVAIRAYYTVPEGAGRVEFSVGVVDALGRAIIHHARLIEIIDVEEYSNPMSTPPPPTACPAPVVAKKVAVVSETAADRRITAILRRCFGERAVQAVEPRTFSAAKLEADAVLFPDPAPPTSIRSIAALKRLAEHKVVIISLPAFAQLSKGVLSLRRVNQPDDPIHARVMYGDFSTRGFALHDAFPFAWPGDEPCGFRQNHFRKTTAFEALRKRHGLVTVLDSVCDQDVTSYRPVCLSAVTEGGALFVMDIEPMEAAPSTYSEPVPAVHLLLSMLGRQQHALGQYTVPCPDAAKLRETIREMSVRFETMRLHEPDLPADQVTHQLVTVGGEDQGFGLALRPRPVILLRSGLASGDIESVHASLQWFKQLVRAEPHVCPYIGALISRFRLAWSPLSAGWQPQTGFRRGHEVEPFDLPLDPTVTDLGAVIDVVTSRDGRARVVVPTLDGKYAHLARWLGPLFEAFAPGKYFTFAPAGEADFADRDAWAWRSVPSTIDVVAEPARFDDPVHRAVQDRGAAVIRVEVPGGDADFTTHSIRRLDVAATMLEQVIGLQFGLIAVNRHQAPVRFNGFAPVAAGQALTVDRDEPMLQHGIAQAG
jgi:hypothetical protein